MAAKARTTGVDPQVEELRRRNVATQPSAPVVAAAPKQEKDKSKDKV